MAARKYNGRGALKTYKSYNFVDKDPIIDVVATARSDAKMSFAQIEKAGGPRAATVRNWEFGKVRRPGFYYVSATLRALGISGITYDVRSGRPRAIK